MPTVDISTRPKSSSLLNLSSLLFNLWIEVISSWHNVKTEASQIDPTALFGMGQNSLIQNLQQPHPHYGPCSLSQP